MDKYRLYILTLIKIVQKHLNSVSRLQMSPFPGKQALSNSALSFSLWQTGSSPYQMRTTPWKMDSPWVPASCLCLPCPKWSRSQCRGIPAHTRCSNHLTSWMGQVMPLAELSHRSPACGVSEPGLRVLLWTIWTQESPGNGDKTDQLVHTEY